MNEKIKKEYIKRLKAILKSKLNSGNTVKAINTCAVPVIRYSADIVDRKNSELCNMDRKTRKVLNMYSTKHCTQYHKHMSSTSNQVQGRHS